MKTKKRIRWLAFQAGLTAADSDKLLDLKELGLERREAPEGCMLHKTAESYRGFLVYVSRTHRAMVPYLKACIYRWIDGARIAMKTDGGLPTSMHRKGHLFGVWSNSVVRGTEFLRFGLTIRYI
jgi:hypothetical protein